MTRKIYLYSLFAAISLMFGSCDYNENNFPGFDDNPLEEIAQYEGDFTGAYPDNGYFIVDKNGNDYVIASEDAAAFQTSMNDMMKKLYPYADKTSSAKISNVLTGDVTKGMDQADISYTLVTADYDAMGTENGQPGRYNNFEEDMDIDGYLTSFCATKYADEAIGTTVNITYVLYTGSNSNQSRIYEKTSDGWIRSDMKAFTADFSYTLQKDDYDSMGTNSGEPGRYDNFDSGMNPDFYLPIFLKEKFPYAKDNVIYSIDYKFYSDGTTVTRTAIYRYKDDKWNAYDPYTDEVKLTAMTAELTFDGTNWVLDRLVGSSIEITFEADDYKTLLDWVIANKPAYKSTLNDNDEYYFGASAAYNNINNKYNTWKKYYDVEGTYASMSDEELQAVMDERLEWGIINLILPKRVTEPEADMSYMVIYKIYGGRGDGNYAMSFVYNAASNSYEKTAGPVAVQ